MRGVPAKRVQELIDRGVLPAKAVYRVVPERTFKRRLVKREALKPSEAEKEAGGGVTRADRGKHNAAQPFEY